MQTWRVRSEFLGLLRVTFDEQAMGQTFSSKNIQGAIVQIDILQSGKSSDNSSKEFFRFQTALQDYESGNLKAFDDLSLQISGTEFQSKVLRNIRKIAGGTVVTYGELAKLSGNPKAYRAVASVCASNKIPLLIPCHRVVPADYSVGQYASRHLKNGPELKAKLLYHENALER